MKKIGIALGGGGAKGLAHIPLLEVLDDLGVTPTLVSGTSIGAIVGALYASGRSAQAMRDGVEALTSVPGSWKEAVEAKQLFGWLDYIDIDIGSGGLLQVDKFLDDLGNTIGVDNIEELKIPLKVVASDFWNRDEVVFDSGPIISAVSASFAIPGIFKPVVQNGRVLFDGGCVNPVPYDLLQDQCDVVIAINVMGQREPEADLLPSYSETLFNTFQIAETTILKNMLSTRPPTIYIEPQISDVKVLDFHKADQIYEQTRPARQQLETELKAILG